MKTIIIKDGNYSIQKLDKQILGGFYVVLNHQNKTAKTGLSLDSAYEVFRQLTLKQTLTANKLI